MTHSYYSAHRLVGKIPGQCEKINKYQYLVWFLQPKIFLPRFIFIICKCKDTMLISFTCREFLNYFFHKPENCQDMECWSHAQSIRNDSRCWYFIKSFILMIESTVFSVGAIVGPGVQHHHQYHRNNLHHNSPIIC